MSRTKGSKNHKTTTRWAPGRPLYQITVGEMTKIADKTGLTHNEVYRVIELATQMTYIKVKGGEE